MGKKGVKYKLDTVNGQLSAKQLSVLLKVHVVTVSRWLTKRSAPTLRHAVKISNAMGITMAEVYDMFPGPCDYVRPSYLKASSKH